MGATNLLTSGLNFLVAGHHSRSCSTSWPPLHPRWRTGHVLAGEASENVGVRRARALSSRRCARRAGSTRRSGSRRRRRCSARPMPSASGSTRWSPSRAGRLFYETQLLVKLVPNLFQSLIFILVIVGLGVMHASATTRHGVDRRDHPPARALGAKRPAGIGHLSGAVTEPAVHRTYAGSGADATPTARRPEGHVPLQTVQTLAFDGVSYGYRPDRPVLSSVSFQVAAERSSASSVRPAPASRR